MVTQTIAGYRLSPQQKHLWLLQENNSNYQATCTIKITGKVEANVLKSAIEKIVERHEIFKTTFQRRPGIKMPLQVISDTAKISWTYVNLSHLNSEEQQVKFEEILQQENLLISQLEPEPIFSSSLLNLGSKSHILLISLPSLLADSLTLKNLVAELAQSYHICLKNRDFEAEAVQYLQYSEWQNELLEDEEAAEEIAYWQRQNFSWVTLPFEKQLEKQVRGEVKFKPERYSLAINPQIEAKLSSDVSFDKFLLACWQTLLWRLTKKTDIAVKTVVSGRQFEELQEVMGLLAKSLPICCEFSDNLKFSELLGQVSDRSTEAEEKQEYFTDTPATEPSLNFEFIDLSGEYLTDELSWKIETQSVIFDRFKVKLNCLKTGEEIKADFEYDPEIISREAIACFATQFETLAINAVENLNAPVGELKLASETEIQHLLNELNQTQKTYPQDKCVRDLFEERVKQTPNNVAVVFKEQLKEQQLTYGELNEKANQLAHYLQELGVVPETIVGIYLERSLDLVVALLAILKSGAAYLPIDTALPVESLAFRLEDAGVKVLLTQQEIPGEILGENVKVARPGKLSDIDVAASPSAIKIIAPNDANINRQSKANPANSAALENLAYILYTSGSTGQPKGVAIERRQILNYLYAILDKLQPETIANFATVSTFAADLGNTMIFPALCSGGCLHVIPQEVASDAEAMADYFRSRAIDYLKIVPSHLATLLASSPSPSLLPRRGLILGGEASSWDLIEQIRERNPQCSIINHYGPTETTVGAIAYNVENRETNAQTVPIGRPLANAQVYILNEKLEPVTVGVSGELYIAGAGLARGYLNRPELTAEKFVTKPGMGRLYKTGDLVRYLPDGNIEFLGRIDNQVKIRGYRIELGEIEAAIASHPEVKTAVVVARPGKFSGSDVAGASRQEITREDGVGNKRLIAYFVCGKNQLSQENLRQFLQNKLADYAIPSVFVKLDFIPLTPNGKIDRQGLPDPDSLRPELENNFVAPRTPSEEILANIWSQLLGIEKIGVFDNFFALGGHSLQGMQLVAKVSAAMQINISVRTLFSHPTIAELAEAVGELLREKNEAKPIIKTAQNNGEFLEKSDFLQIERRPLFSLFAAGKIPPVDAAALWYLRDSYLEETGLSREEIIENFCDNLPVWLNVREIHLPAFTGRMATIILPRFSGDLYSDRRDAISVIIEALEMAKQIGAKTVSLTGLIPSATDYGRAITEAIANRQDLPKITTGHGTTCSTVALTIKKICEAAGRDFSGEKVGFIGLGSVGISTLRLMLKCLPHPQEILLCDVYNKRDFLEKIQQELVQELGCSAKVLIAASQAELPPEIYDATLIVGATNAPNVLDIKRVKPGTIIVDDSAPHCFAPEEAIARFKQQEDILFTEGGVLRSPLPLTELRYLPSRVEKAMSYSQKQATFNRNPANITGCVLSSLLSSRFEKIEPTVGIYEGQKSLLHYQTLTELKFDAADLHCGEYALDESSIQNFRRRFGS